MEASPPPTAGKTSPNARVAPPTIDAPQTAEARPGPEALTARIEALAEASRALDPGPADRKRLQDAVMAYSQDFLDALPTAKAYVDAPGADAGLEGCAIAESARPVEEVLAAVGEFVDGPALNPASGGHLGYIPGGGLYPSALGDYLAAVTNRFAGLYFAAPGAVRMGNMLLRWMAELVGYPPEVGGDLASGGSIANLTAVVTAREAKWIRSANVPRAVVYTTRHAHHCIGKALVVAGLRESIVRHVEMDDGYRMSPQDLADKIEADRRNRLLPFMVVATAGTTDTGAVDPIDEIADVTAANDVWCHVDAAYGGFFALCPEAPPALSALHRADSLVLDPHKGLFLPYGTGALLVRDREALRNAHTHVAPYLRDAWEDEASPSPADHSPELSRHFRAMRLWLPLQLFGLAPFRAALSEKYWLARYLYEKVQHLPHVEVGPEPDLSVVMFRWTPPGRDANEANEALIRRIHADGRVFLSSTVLGGEIWLRFGVLSFRTHKETADLALEVVQDAARAEAGDY